MMIIRVALVEDDEFLARAIREKLSFFDDVLQFRYTAKNGLDLIEKLAADHAVDAILMNVEMPEMDGIQATELVKQKHPQIKVIILTVFDDEDKIRMGRRNRPSRRKSASPHQG